MRTGSRRRSSQEIANMPGDIGMPPHGDSTSASGQDPSCTASLTALAAASGSATVDSSTELVMNQPTESCQLVSKRLCTGKTARSGASASSRVTEVIAATASASVDTPSLRACTANAAPASTSNTSRTSTRSGPSSGSPNGSGNRGITPPLSAMMRAQVSRTWSGAAGRSSSAWVCSTNAGACGSDTVRPIRASVSSASRSRAITSIDHMSTWLWSAAITTVNPAAVSNRHNRCEGR